MIKEDMNLKNNEKEYEMIVETIDNDNKNDNKKLKGGNSKYEFKRTEINYENNKISLNVELCRLKLFNKIVIHISNILHKYNITKTIKKKYTFNGAIKQNVLARTILSHLSKIHIHLKDGLFPYNLDFDINEIMCDTFQNYLELDDNMKKEILEKINLKKKFNDAIIILKNKKFENIKYKKVKSENNNFIIFFIKDLKFEIPIITYDKLKKRFLEYNENIKKTNYNIDNIILCLLIRYYILSSKGNQWAMPNKVKEEFRKEYGVNFECFASSFNHYYDYYCSIFYDIEKYFMSLGPLQNIKYISGFYMLNPPYVEDTLIMMTNIILKSINSKKELSFMFGLPNWTNFPVLENVKKSKYLTKNVEIGDGKVDWVDHMTLETKRTPKNNRYLIQNELGKKNNNPEKFEEILNNFWIK
jgi:hypothetical protein